MYEKEKRIYDNGYKSGYSSGYEAGKADNNSLLISMAEALTNICDYEGCAYDYDDILDIAEEILKNN